ncbi:DUF4446 domain-containing protein [Paenibacillus sediminis]|uniref:DUF4446 family protein n=1 Tax=Paenibacillus sediminis TaxID=664909 RepID=A0ABS4H6V3_9BACL|nr:DUF4446 family protein [Paenibacillus sediminis]MBP1938259.1 hypothetical protein [Paenibacillus sediminis]
MAELNALIMGQIFSIVSVLIFIVFVMFIVMIAQGSKLRKMRRKYELMMSGSGVENLESYLIDLKLQLDRIEEGQEAQQKQIRALQEKARKMKAKVGMKRYNAFAEHGSELSFSLAILNEQQDGVVITSIYNRDGSLMYSKQIKGGESMFSLSPEEKEAITLALQEE